MIRGAHNRKGGSNQFLISGMGQDFFSKQKVGVAQRTRISDRQKDLKTAGS